MKVSPTKHNFERIVEHTKLYSVEFPITLTPKVRMSMTSSVGSKELEKLIVKNIPRDAFMAFEDAYHDGDIKGREQAAAFALGHRPSAAGQVKHFYTNEAFHEALEAHGAAPSALRGSRLVVGRLGIFNIARLNVAGHKWVNLRRGATRKRLAEVNLNIEEKYVQSDFFNEKHEVAQGTIFVLGVVDGKDANGIAQLTQVMVALPSPAMTSWLYLNTMAEFLALYDVVHGTGQVDNAVPKLKKQPKKQSDNDQGN